MYLIIFVKLCNIFEGGIVNKKKGSFSMFAGNVHRGYVQWHFLPSESELIQEIEVFLSSLQRTEVPQWPAFSSKKHERFYVVTTRRDPSYFLFVGHTLQVQIPPIVYSQLLEWTFLWNRLRKSPTSLDREAFETAVELSKKIISGFDIEEILKEITLRATRLLNAERGSLFLLDESCSCMETHITVKRDPQSNAIVEDKWTHITIPRGRGILWLSVEKGQALVVNNVREHPDFYPEIDAKTGFYTRNLVSIPLISQHEPLGCIQILNKIEGEFDENDKQIGMIFAGMATPFIHLALKHRQLQDAKEKLEKLNALLQAQIELNQAEIRKLKTEILFNQAVDKKTKGYYHLVGQSKAMQEVYQIIERIKDTDFHVLIIGESGTGKELVARSIHDASRRANARFVAINCAAIPETLMERELFGAEKGAYTGAYETQKGLFETADGGTIFLDEISEMPLSMQAKLLRVLEEKEIRRVGGTTPIQVNVRIIAATNKDLEEYVKSGRFRPDLYYRLNVVRIELPPLRERLEDIPILVDYFLSKIMKETNLSHITVDPEVIRIFMNYDWPGNVRQLQNELRRMVAIGRGHLKPDDVSPNILSVGMRALNIAKEGVAKIILREKKDFNLEHVEKQLIEIVLNYANGNKSLAAQLLGISRRTLYMKMKKFGLL